MKKTARKSGIPTGNAGEYFVMGELLRRGYDAQLADRNTKHYDLLVGRRDDAVLRKVQVKSVRAAPWYVSKASFQGDLLDQITVYVLIGKEDAKSTVQYFIAKNRYLAEQLHHPAKWTENKSAFMPLKAVVQYRDKWTELGTP